MNSVPSAAQQTDEESEPPAKQQKLSTSSPAKHSSGSDSGLLSLMSPQHSTPLSLDWPSSVKRAQSQQQETEQTKRKKSQHREPFFVKPGAFWEVLSVKRLTEVYGMEPRRAAQTDDTEHVSGEQGDEAGDGGGSDVVAVGEMAIEESGVVEGKGEKASHMESSFVLQLALSQGDVSQSEIQQQQTNSSKFAGDTETDGENSSIVATPSQSIIALANPTDEDIDDQTTRQTSTESSKQPQQEQDEKPSEQSEGGLGVSGQGGSTEGTFQLSLPGDGDHLHSTPVSTTSLFTAHIQPTATASVVSSCSMTMATTLCAATSVHSPQLSPSLIVQTSIMSPTAESPTHSTVSKTKRSLSTRITAATSPEYGIMGGVEEQGGARQQSVADVFGLPTASSIDTETTEPAAPKAVKKVRITRRVITEHIEDRFIAEDGSVVFVEHSELRHEPTYLQQEEQLREQMEVPTEQQGKEGAQRTRARKRLRSMARVGLAASKSSSSTSGEKDTIRRKPPRRQKLLDSPVATSKPLPKKRLVEVATRRSPRRARANLQTGTRVFAKWLDHSYYSGQIQELLPRGRFNVQFDDGDCREISASDIISLDSLPIGSSVLVLYKPLQYENAVVEGYCTVKGEPGYVVRRSGRMEKYPRSQVILSSDQASVLYSSSSSSPPRGPRDTDSSDTSPKFRRVATSTARQTSMSSATSSRKDNKQDSKHASESPRNATSSGKQKSTGKSVTFVNEKATRGASVRGVSSTAAIFRDWLFVVTRGDQQKGTGCTSDIAFDKEQLTEQITEFGGQIIDDLSEIKDFSQCFVIASGPCRTIKYLQALACGVPCVSHTFIHDSIEQGWLLNHKRYLLPAGFSYELNRNVNCIERMKRATSDILENERIIVDGDPEFRTDWSKILTMCGARVRQKLPRKSVLLNENDQDRESNWCDCVISSGRPSASLQRRAGFFGIPIVSVNWATQCLINGQKMDFNGDERYHYEYKET